MNGFPKPTRSAPPMPSIKPPAFDYRALLVRYMAAVIAAEGISYVDAWRYEVEGLLPEELAELKRIEPEAIAGMNK